REPRQRVIVTEPVGRDGVDELRRSETPGSRIVDDHPVVVPEDEVVAQGRQVDDEGDRRHERHPETGEWARAGATHPTIFDGAPPKSVARPADPSVGGPSQLPTY